MDIAIRPLRLPCFYTICAGIVGCQRIFNLTTEAVDHVLEVSRAKLKVYAWIGELLLAEAAHADFFGQIFSHMRQQLHQPPGVGARNRLWVELGFLADQT